MRRLLRRLLGLGEGHARLLIGERSGERRIRGFGGEGLLSRRRRWVRRGLGRGRILCCLGWTL